MKPASNPRSDLSGWIVDQLDELKARDVAVLDVSRLTTITDQMVIASGTSSRHVSSLVEHLLVEAKRHGLRVFGVEGKPHCEWVLVDLGEALVHVMQPETRLFYDLEKLWSTPLRGQSSA